MLRVVHCYVRRLYCPRRGLQSCVVISSCLLSACMLDSTLNVPKARTRLHRGANLALASFKAVRPSTFAIKSESAKTNASFSADHGTWKLQPLDDPLLVRRPGGR